MKTTIDLPEVLLTQAKVYAARHQTTVTELVQIGLTRVLTAQGTPANPKSALVRLRKGLRLGGQPLTRDQAHERHEVP